ncbi:unnamed protein product [Clonostachys byssicola]|uniref:AB hydrolase-1 domain-containing protein n=1 Tax=Clonostachys byssicola TaxID=160290 RepID=A0A9N9UR17_9HYPO|nr:unnamed protein product [Clonostachys byssicola]
MATYETALDQRITVGDQTFAYRLFGNAGQGVTLALLHGFRGTMDHWDPKLINGFAATRRVLLVENVGVGRSSGEVPKSLPAWAQHYIDVFLALHLRQVDILGYSMGGCVAQLVALNAPAGLIRRIVLCGTTPSSGDGVVRAPLGPFNQIKAAQTESEHKDAFLSSFFTSSKASQAAGLASWNRMVSSRPDRIDQVPAEAAHRQAVAFAKFMDPKQASEGSYDRFRQIRQPVLIANGSNDLLLPTENSILMWNMLKDEGAQLHLYPDSGHAFLYQYATQFARTVNDFLDEPAPTASKL